MEERIDTGADNGHEKDLKEVAASKLRDLRDWSGDALGRVETLVRDRPATAMLIALGAGFVIGRLARRIG